MSKGKIVLIVWALLRERHYVIYIELVLPRNVVAGAEGWYYEGSQLSLEVTEIPAPGSLAMLAMGSRLLAMFVTS